MHVAKGDGREITIGNAWFCNNEVYHVRTGGCRVLAKNFLESSLCRKRKRVIVIMQCSGMGIVHCM